MLQGFLPKIFGGEKFWGKKNSPKPRLELQSNIDKELFSMQRYGKSLDWEQISKRFLEFEFFLFGMEGGVVLLAGGVLCGVRGAFEVDVEGFCQHIIVEAV